MTHNLYKTLIFNTLFIFLSFSSFSQNAFITGVIMDGEFDEPMISATIAVGNKGVVSDMDGKFSLELPPGEHQVSISYVGYQTETKKFSLSAGETQEWNLTLKVQTNVLQTATVTSGKFEKPLGEVTVSLEVLKPALISNSNASSIDGVLSKLPGLNFIGGQANIRGGSGWSYGAGSRVLLLVDDIPALQADAGTTPWDDVAIENIEQVEVIKGAASALYGSSALNGIINVRTAYAKSKPYTKLSMFHTTYGSPKDISKKWWATEGGGTPFENGLSIAHRQKIKKLDLVLSGFYLDRKSVNQTSVTEYGRISVGTRYRINDNLSVGFNSVFNPGKSASFFLWRNGEEGGYQPPEVGNFGSTTKRMRYFIDPFITYFDKSGNKHKLMGRYYNINNENSDNRSNTSQLVYGEYQFQKKFDSQNMVLTAGFVNTQSKSDSELFGDTIYTNNNIATYLQVDKKVFDKLNLSAGFRYEYNNTSTPVLVQISDFVNDTIPDGKITEGKPVFRFGANYQINESTFLRASWGQGYRNPTIAERFIRTDAGFQILPNPRLQSESGWTAEMGIKKGAQISNWYGFVDVAAFWSEYQDMMEFQFDPVLFGFQSNNIGNTVIKGLELSIGGQGKIGSIETDATMGYTFIDPKYKEGFFTEDVRSRSSHCYEENSSVETCENILKYRSKHSIKADLETKYKKVSLGVAVLYNSHMVSVDQAIAGLGRIAQFRARNNKGYTKLDARIGFHFDSQAKISFLVNNLLNQEYTERPGILQPPRNIAVRAEYQF